MDSLGDKMHPHEEATIRAFIRPAKRARWLEKLASSKHRKSFLDQLNHCRDIDDRYAKPLPAGTNAVSELKSRGALADCHVTSNIEVIDGQDLPLCAAIE